MRHITLYRLLDAENDPGQCAVVTISEGSDDTSQSVCPSSPIASKTPAEQSRFRHRHTPALQSSVLSAVCSQSSSILAV